MTILPIVPTAAGSWREAALCAQTDPELFYPEKGQSPEAAKAICAACPVRASCLSEALLHDVRFGIWGGLSERQRRAMRKARSQGGSG